MSVDPRHHRHFVSRKADVLRQISDECGAVTITFPRFGSKSDKVVLKGAKQCVDAARQRIVDVVADLVCTSVYVTSVLLVFFQWTWVIWLPFGFFLHLFQNRTCRFNWHWFFGWDALSVPQPTTAEHWIKLWALSSSGKNHRQPHPLIICWTPQVRTIAAIMPAVLCHFSGIIYATYTGTEPVFAAENLWQLCPFETMLNVSVHTKELCISVCDVCLSYGRINDVVIVADEKLDMEWLTDWCNLSWGRFVRTDWQCSALLPVFMSKAVNFSRPSWDSRNSQIPANTMNAHLFAMNCHELDSFYLLVSQTCALTVCYSITDEIRQHIA